MKIIKYLFIISTLYFSLPTYLLCDGFASPLGPGEKEKDNILGILLGFGQNIQNGVSLVDCDSCQFQNGLGFGYTFGFTYEKQVARKDDDPILSKFFYGAMFCLGNKSVSASYKEIRQQPFNEYALSFPITYRQLNEISVMSVGLMPYLSYYPIKYLFVRLGLEASFVFNANSKHTMELVNRKETLPNGEVVDIYINNQNKKAYSIVLQDLPIDNLNKFQLGLVPMLGGNIYFSNKLICSPSFSYYIPFQSLVSSSNLSISTWRLNVEFRYNLAMDSRIYKSSSNKRPKIVKRK
jgi:hypothetical protein